MGHAPLRRPLMDRPTDGRCRNRSVAAGALSVDSRSSYAVPFYSPAFANARHWTVALLFGSLFRAMGGIDPEFDHIVDDTALQSFRHDPDDGAAVHCASDIGTDPCKFVEVVPHNPGTIVQSEMGCHPGRDREREAGIVIPRRDGCRDDPELAPGLIGAQDKARPCLSSILKPALFLGTPEVDIADDIGGLRLSP